jgi:hypothetical protein
MKILFFDYWTRGIKHFSRLKGGLVREGNEVVLLHTGSWRQKDIPKEEMIDGLLCRDISHYNDNLAKALHAEAPDILIGLNYSHLLDRIVIRYCRLMNIYTLHLMHGVRAMEPQILSMQINTINETNSVWKILKRVIVYSRLLIHYYHSGKKIITPNDLKYIMELFVSPGKTLLLPSLTEDIIWNKALVYSISYKKYFVDQIGFKKRDVIITGNPELDNAIKLSNLNNGRESCLKYLRDSKINLSHTDNNILLLIDQPLVETGLITQEVRINEIKSLAAICDHMKYDLIVKLHPSTVGEPLSNIQEIIPNLHVIKKGNNEKLMLVSRIVAGRSSTLLMMAIILNKPIIQLQRKIGNSNLYDPIILKTHIGEMEKILINPEKFYYDAIDKESRAKYIEEKIGPVNGNATDSIISCILDQNTNLHDAL